MKTVLITGSTQGIGKELALIFSANGYNVIGTQRTDSKQPYYLNFSDISSIDPFVASLNIDSIYAVVNNIGICPDAGETLLSVDNLKLAMEVNVYSTVSFTELLLIKIPNIELITNISSKFASLSSPGPSMSPAYSISKTAINAYTKYLEKVLPETTKVVSLDPGWVQTRLGGPAAPLTPEESANRIYKLVNADNYSNLKTGNFYTVEGEVAW